MSQQQSGVPQNILNFFSGCGMSKSWIENCWNLSGQDENRMNELIFLSVTNDQNQIKDLNQEQLEISKLEEHVSKTIQLVTKINSRQKGNFVGIKNTENDGILNLMLQLIHQIPMLYKLILGIRCSNTNKQGQFLRCIQLLLTELTVSNSSCISSKYLQNASLWNLQDRKYMEFENNPIIIFFFLLTKIDQAYYELNQQVPKIKQSKFFNEEFNALFSFTIQNNQIQERINMLVTEMNESSVYSFLYENYKKKVAVLPQILCIQIKRNQQNQRKIFDINQALELEFLKPDFQGSSRMNQINQQNTQEDLEQLQKDLSNFSHSIHMMKQDGTLIDIIKILESKQRTLEKQLASKNHAFSQQISALESQSNENKYAIHSITIQRGEPINNTSVLYVFNFYSKKWLKFQNSICQIDQENEILIISQKYAVFVTYINTNLIQLFANHQEKLTEIGNLISTNPSYLLNQNTFLKNQIPQDLLMEAYNNNEQNRKQFRQ